MFKTLRVSCLFILFVQFPVLPQLPFALTSSKAGEITIQEPEMADSTLLLIMAAERGDTDSVIILIEEGFDINHATGDGVTAIMYAASNGSLDIVQLLADNGADIDMVPQNGVTALAGAAMNNHFEVTLYLLQQSADTEVEDDRGLTPLMHASSRDYFDVTELLLMFGADPDHKDLEGATALHGATLYAQPDIVWLLLDYGGNINAADDFGWTPLMMAVQLGRMEMAGYLIENDAEINVRTRDGLSALAIAIANSRTGIAEKLIELGADTKIRVSGTDNLMNLALWQGNEEIISLMRQQGVRRNILPDFRILRISAGMLLNFDDYFNGLRASLEDDKYNLLLSAGWDTRPVRRAVLVEYDTRWFDQFWEQRHIFYGGLAMKFPVMDYFRINDRGFYAGLSVAYSKGRYWGSYNYPEPKWHLVPSVGYYNEASWWYWSAGYEYLQLDITEKAAHRLTISIGLRFSVKRYPLIYRTTYW